MDRSDLTGTGADVNGEQNLPTDGQPDWADGRTHSWWTNALWRCVNIDEPVSRLGDAADGDRDFVSRRCVGGGCENHRRMRRSALAKRSRIDLVLHRMFCVRRHRSLGSRTHSYNACQSSMNGFNAVSVSHP